VCVSVYVRECVCVCVCVCVRVRTGISFDSTTLVNLKYAVGPCGK